MIHRKSPHRGIVRVCRLLYPRSSTTTEFAPTEITLYRRCTISPSVATNTSSLCSRNASRFPLAPMATPKNFKSIGGGGGGPVSTTGGGATTATLRTGAIGLGISTGAEFAEKIFLPFPEYTSDSVTSIASIRSVGSSCAEVVPTFFAALPTTFPGGTATVLFAAVVVFTEGDVVMTGGGGGAGVS